MTAIQHLGGLTGGVNVPAGTSRYWALAAGIFITSIIETNASVVYRSGGTFSQLYAYIAANANTGNSTVKIRKDAANGNQTITVGSGVTGSVVDNTNTDTLSAGSKYAVAFNASASGGNLTPSSAGVTLAASSNSYTRLGTSLGGTANTINTFYSALCGGGLGGNTTEANAQFKNKNTATLQNLALNVTVNTSAAATVKTRKNGADGNQSITISSGATGTMEDNTNTDSISSGDLINTSINVTAVTALTITYIAVEYLSTASKSIMAANSGGASANQTNYTIPAGQNTTSTTEANAINQAQAAFTASFFESYVPANGVTASSTFRFRKNTANGNMNFSVGSGATGYFEDNTNTDSIAANDNFNYAVVAGATGTTMTIRNMGITIDYGGSSFVPAPYYYLKQVAGF